ncbi:MAG: peptidase [Opitutus sp.]|nr:peptidase [Opitutus sp.]
MRYPTLFVLSIAVLASVGCGPRRSANGPAPVTTIAAKVATLKALPGFLPLYWDERAGKLWFEIARFDTDFLYVTSLPAGLGSNDIGLDRGQLGRERVVRFQRSGNKVLLVQPNLAFRASGTDAEKRAVADSFAQSVIGGFEVGAEEGGRVLVDGTAFFLRDAHDVIGALKRARQGAYTLDEKRSAFFLPNVKAFPRNSEIEVTLTFAGTEPGQWVRDVAPDPGALTVRARHSFVQLPGPGYTPRAFDPRGGFFPTSYADYSAPLGEPVQRRFITRHRLQKKTPGAAPSEPVQPIVYYLDPATPEPIRSALLDGAKWWAQAFEAAGFVNAYRVELLPEDADPMDVRYNVIQWVHRATRGWSYGSSVTDPRTGEIIKGHVSLGSLRVRQDYLIAEGLLAPYEKGKAVSPEMQQMALARLRQLSAHEIGHTLGLSHNYIASTQGRASVMDYPHPVATLKDDGTIALADAYATGIGEWDKVTIAWGYTELPTGETDPAPLTKMLDDARARGLTYLTDQDARPLGSPHPFAHLWDNGANAINELQRLLRVRAAALARFGENAIPVGRPLATLEETLVPLYLMHRYQIEAAAKSLAGVTYTYALRGDGQTPLTSVAPQEQRRALATLLAALQPSVLALPESILQLIPPRPEGYDRHRELFANRTAGSFDALAPAETLAQMTFSALFEPGRAARLVEQSARDASQPSLDEVIETALNATWGQPAGADYAGEIQRSVSSVFLAQLLSLAAEPATTTQVRAIATTRLMALRERLARDAASTNSPAQQAHFLYGARLIGQFLENPKDFVAPRLPAPPPGQPIGMACEFD